MDNLPQRDDSNYKEIEEFQDYELTNCIAYEMAIRNDKVIKLIEKRKKLELEYTERNKNIEEFTKDFFDLYEIYHEKENQILIELEVYGIDKIFLYNDIYVVFEDEKEYLINLREKFRPIYFVDKNDKNIHKYTENIKLGKIEQKGYIRNPIIDFRMARQKLKFKLKKIIDIDLNLNLPKEELIAYISKIKDEYDKNNSIIKTPLELLGETLEKSDNKKTPKKPKASVYADWFYIYDYWKYEKTQGKTDKDIFVALEVEKNVLYKEDMLRKIRDKMKYFIDDLGYQELITGVKNS